MRPRHSVSTTRFGEVVAVGRRRWSNSGMNTHKCFKCKQIKNVSEFYPRGNKSHGFTYCKQCNAISTHQYKITLQNTVIEALGGCCEVCGFRDKRALQIDHINGGGAVQRRAGKNWLRIYREILSSKTDKYQLLCANCNWIKRAERKEYGGRGLLTTAENLL